MNTRSAVVALSTVLIAASVAAGGFVYGRSAKNTSVDAQDAPIVRVPAELQSRDDFWYVPLLEAEAAKPRLVGTFAGIQVGPEVDDVDVCAAVGEQSAERSRIALERVADHDPAMAPPAYLPAQATYQPGPGSGGLVCGTTLGIVTATYDFPLSESSLYGGDLSFARLRGPRRAAIDVAADRAEVTTIAGRNALIVHPLTPDGFGDSYALIAEPGGLTYIQAFGLPMSEVLRIAESLYGGGQQ